MIEQMRTIPYVSLGHFEFISVNWVEDNVEDNVEILNKVVEDKQPTINWGLVKRMIFSKMITKNIKTSNRSDRNESISEDKTEIRNEKSKKASIKRGIVDQFNVYDYLRVFKSKSIENDDKSTSERSVSKFLKSTRKSNDKRKKSILNKLKSKSNQDTTSELDLRKINKKEIDSQEISTSKKNKFLLKNDLTKLSKRMLGKRKEILLNLTELASSKRFHRLNLIMSKDDGPFMTDYRFLLGIEFWSNYCGIEKHQLISVCSNDFWLNEINSFQSDKTLKENQQFKSKKEHNKLSELKQFLKGTDKPARAPQRVISSEEKFKLIPYPKLFNPNTDLKKTFHTNTLQDQLNKKLKKIYKTLVYIVGGTYPLIRRVDFEEAYEDILLWVLDTYQAKTRFIAILNDQIKWDIN